MFLKKIFHRCCICLTLTAAVLGSSLALPMSPVQAEVPDYNAEAEARKSLPVQSNDIQGWPEGPSIGAEGAILMEADTGVILYAKNIHEPLYPASVTKILTTLIAAENCELDEVVTFSHDAVFSIPLESSRIAIDEGEELTVDQCLQAILIASANEVANALGEHIAGSMDSFVDMMNEKAKELGCVDSHFVTINGLHDDKHYTSAYDLAMIGRHFFANELLSKYASTSKLHIPPTDKQPDDIIAWSKNELYAGRPHAYDSLVGSKTGYTEAARQTLVSCAEKDGMRLICVILKEEAPSQYTDTIDLFNYGFSNFQKVNVSQTETKFQVQNTGFFYSNNDVFGNSKPILALNTEDCIVLPKTADFTDTESVISYENPEEGVVGAVTYTYHGAFVGTATIDFADENAASYEFNGEMSKKQEEITASEQQKESVIYINVKKILLTIVAVAGILILIIVIHSLINNYQFGGRRFLRRRSKRSRRNQRTRGPHSKLHF